MTVTDLHVTSRDCHIDVGLIDNNFQDAERSSHVVDVEAFRHERPFEVVEIDRSVYLDVDVGRRVTKDCVSNTATDEIRREPRADPERHHATNTRRYRNQPGTGTPMCRRNAGRVGRLTARAGGLVLDVHGHPSGTIDGSERDDRRHGDRASRRGSCPAKSARNAASSRLDGHPSQSRRQATGVESRIRRPTRSSPKSEHPP